MFVCRHSPVRRNPFRKGNNILDSNSGYIVWQQAALLFGLASALALCCLIVFRLSAFFPMTERRYSPFEFIGKLHTSPVIEKWGFALPFENIAIGDKPDEKQVGMASINGLPIDVFIFTTKLDGQAINRLFYKGWQFYSLNSAAYLPIVLEKWRVQSRAFYKTKSGRCDTSSSSPIVINGKRKLTDYVMFALNSIARRDFYIAEIPWLNNNSSSLFIDDQVNASLCGISRFPRLRQSINRNSPLFNSVDFGVGYLFFKQFNLLLGGISFSPVRQISPDSPDSRYADEDQRPYLDAVRETRLRSLVGFPLFVLGVFLIYYCDRFIDSDAGWRGWLLWLSAFLCVCSSFILLLYRNSLSSLRDLL